MVHLGPALLLTRLVPPRLPAHSVRRERLLRSLDAALQHRLTLISAAAGWGKTILLSAWAASRSQPPIWVTLDERDNHPTRFWITLYTAIQLQLPDVGSLALARLHGSEPLAPSTVLAGLLDDLATASSASPLVIVLDDYHTIGDPALHEGIALLVEHLPPLVHLVIATRVDPDLPLARWRVQGLMHELRSADLRFTHPETHALFTHTLGDGLAEDDAQRLAQRTEGWAAALQVVALALRHQADRQHFVRAFTGSHRLLLDYMHEEVLAQQPPELQRFLLHTSIVGALNAGLCAALTGDGASQSRLEWLERRNLFLTPLDDERRWYRVHDLFREVLLARLRSTEPERLPRLHLRAARWYAEQGELREAIAHAFDADDPAYAAELIERAAPSLWLHGEAATVHAWLHALPDATFWQHARLALDVALRLPDTLRPTDLAAFTDVQIKVEQTLARVEAGLHSPQGAPLPEGEAALLRRRIQLLRAMLDVRTLIRQADIPGLRRLAEAVASLAEREEVRWEASALSCMFWLAFTFRQEEPRIIPRLLRVKERAIQAGDHTTTLATTVFLAHMYRAANQLRLQAQECREGIERARQLRAETAAVGNLQLTLAEACYAENRLDAAADALDQGLHNVRAWGHHDLYLWGLTQRAQLELARHDIPAAAQALQQAEETVQRERFPHWEPTIDATRAQLLLAGGDHVGVDRWLAQTELDPQTLTPNQDVLVLTKARLLIARQRYGQALETLERFAPQFDRPGHLPTTIAFLALLLVALDHAGRQEQARELAVRLFTLSEPEDNLRVFLDSGAPMAQLLARFAAPDGERAALSPRLAAFCARLLAAFGAAERIPAPASPPPSASPQPALAPSSSPEPLTQREHEVLRLLVAGASNQEIANQLVISLATAKKHVSNILAKLGVTSRAQAIARARDLAERS